MVRSTTRVLRTQYKNNIAEIEINKELLSNATTTTMTSTLFKRPRVVTSEEEEEEEEYSTCLSFAEIFSSLAHHFFPDGAPAEYSETYPHGGSWPRRMDRNIISAEEARSSIYNLSSFSRQNGISPREMYAVSLVACATLPQERNQQSNVLTNSKLVDGTSKYFVLLVKCLIPSPLGSEKKDEEFIPAQVISMLLSAAASISCDIPGKCAVLRFLTLVSQSGCLLRGEGSAGEVLSSLYNIPFSMIQCSETVLDAVRLLHAITRKHHVKLYRTQKIRQILQEHRVVDNRTPFASLVLLMQLYEHYQQDSAALPQHFKAITITGDFSRFLHFPEESWKLAFDNQVISLLNNNEEENENSTGSLLLQSTTLEHLQNALDGVSSLSWAFSTTGGTKKSRIRPAVLASDILCDEAARHFICLSSDSSSTNTICTTEIIRLRACLPYMLHDEWYCYDEENNGKDEPPGYYRQRLRLLRALSSFAAHTFMLPPEAISFIVHHILPCYDASDLYEILFRDLIPFCFTNNVCDTILIQRSLSKIYPTASPALQYCIVSGGLTKTISIHNIAMRTTQQQLYQLVLWVDNLIMTGLISSSSSVSTKSIILLSALDFYEAACTFCLSKTRNIHRSIIFPSPSITYRWLLSETPLCIDRACNLLLKFKTLLEEMKDNNQNMLRANSLDHNDEKKRHIHPSFSIAPVEERERYITIFNCYIWDFCSALWRCPDLTPLLLKEEEEVGSSAHVSSSSTSSIKLHSILFTDLSEATLRDLHLEHRCFITKVQYSLSITHSAAFSGFASHFLQEHIIQKKAICSSDVTASPSPEETLSPDFLTGNTKVKYLDYLRDIGFSGLHSFLTTFVGSLSTREAKKKQRKRSLEETLSPDDPLLNNPDGNNCRGNS